nr:hypothetical protein HmN_000351900 [Hymenolepis microstoma]
MTLPVGPTIAPDVKLERFTDTLEAHPLSPLPHIRLQRTFVDIVGPIPSSNYFTWISTFDVPSVITIERGS